VLHTLGVPGRRREVRPEAGSPEASAVGAQEDGAADAAPSSLSRSVLQMSKCPRESEDDEV